MQAVDALCEAWAARLASLVANAVVEHLGAGEHEVELGPRLHGQRRRGGSADSVAAGSSTYGSGGERTVPASLSGSVEPLRAARRAQSRQARPEEAQEPGWGAAEGGTLTVLKRHRGRAGALPRGAL